MSARGIIGGIAGMAASAVKHPVATTEQTIKAAKQMATTGTIVADKLVKRGLGKDGSTAGTAAGRTAPTQARETAAKAAATAAESVEKAAVSVERSAEKVADRAEEKAEETESPAAKRSTAKKLAAEKSAAQKAPTKKAAAKKAPAKKAPAKKAAAKKPAAKKGPKPDDHDVVLSVDFPAPPEEPPVDVVGEALAKEAEAEQAGGGSPLPPVRDQDEAGVDPATVKAVRSEAEMMKKAASPRRG